MKKFLSFCLAVVIAFGCLPVFDMYADAASVSAGSSLSNYALSTVNKTKSALGVPGSAWCCYYVGHCINNSSVSDCAGEEISKSESANAITLMLWLCGEQGIAQYYSFSSTHTKRLGDFNSLKPYLNAVNVNSFTPVAGDIIVFDWSGRENKSHVFSHAGIVTSFDGLNVTYVDGNSSGKGSTTVLSHTKKKTEKSIIGYIRIDETLIKDRANKSSNTDVYYIVSALNGEKSALSVSGDSIKSTANVHLWARHSGDSEKWICSTKNGYKTFTNLKSGMALDVAWGSKKSGSNVWQYKPNGTSSQLWTVEDAGSGLVYLKSKLGNYLDVSGAGTENGTNVQVWNKNMTDAQKFRLVGAYYFDLNGLLNGEARANLDGFATADVYVNGHCVANDVSDYYVRLAGDATWEIKDVKTKTGYTYKGCTSGALKGKVGNGVNVRLAFGKN